MYSPLAIKQKPAKNRNTNATRSRDAAASDQAKSGDNTPNTGPDHATTFGDKLCETSVRENENGYKTTRDTSPPVETAARLRDPTHGLPAFRATSQ